MVVSAYPKPSALNLSKGCFALGGEGEGQGFDKLSPNGVLIEAQS
jgi:hypothetical protein